MRDELRRTTKGQEKKESKKWKAGCVRGQLQKSSP